MGAMTGALDERTPRERMLTDAAGVLQVGAIAYGVFAAIIFLCGALAGLGAARDLPDMLKSILLYTYTGSSDTALAILILLALAATSLLLVAMVAVLAREIWVVPLLALLIVLALAGVILLGFTPGLPGILVIVVAGRMMLTDLRAFRINPVMLKELRGRMRGFRAFAVISIYLGLMGAIALLLYLVFGSFARGTGSAAAGEIGRVLFFGIAAIELLLILFIAPAFTAGAITGERERQTYDLLQTTLLAKATFVIGKLEAALSYIVLLLLSGIPLQSLAFLFGGISEAEIALSVLLLLVTAVLLGTVGIYFSAALPRTLVASARAYGAALAVMFIVPVVISVIVNILNDLLFIRQGALPSPPMEALLRYIDLLLTSVNPAAAGISAQSLLIDQRVLAFYNYTLRSDGSTIPMVSPWVLFTILYLSASAVLITLTIRKASQDLESL
ncbi:MAG: hypothetical protein L6Q98_14490 [Anaerolineae bacterium]|nr:hypothetical protein [Anaerolineae bacterium]NUQ04189.1 hypothetical protein [Anaerolineae bacterium]